MGAEVVAFAVFIVGSVVGLALAAWSVERGDARDPLVDASSVSSSSGSCCRVMADAVAVEAFDVGWAATLRRSHAAAGCRGRSDVRPPARRSVEPFSPPDEWYPIDRASKYTDDVRRIAERRLAEERLRAAGAVLSPVVSSMTVDGVTVTYAEPPCPECAGVGLHPPGDCPGVRPPSATQRSIRP